MDCYTMRMDDRLSALSDDLILKILSFVSLKDAVRTSVLSHRWRHLWTSIPHLSFSSQDFSSMRKLSKSVARVLSCRNVQVQLSSFNLYLHGKRAHDVAQKIMNHVFSLNVQHVNFTCLFETGQWYSMPYVEFPLSLSGSQTLKHLTLKRSFSPCDEINHISTGVFVSNNFRSSFYHIIRRFSLHVPQLEESGLSWLQSD
ncbi:putative F-box domain, leucine-rich repeat domain superfamily, F-box-like domain superfamily [Helianthus annuus]|nr:putative F-box domain, leucine-rich repeat domain superfamily, F-box-like domain superfamily [Helianthus annuus]